MSARAYRDLGVYVDGEYWPYAAGDPHGSGLLCLGCVYSRDPHYHSPSYWGLNEETDREH